MIIRNAMENATSSVPTGFISERPQMKTCITKPKLARRKTLGHLKSINPNMINYFANQSQTCQLLEILKHLFSNIEKKLWNVVQSQVELIGKSHFDYRGMK